MTRVHIHFRWGLFLLAGLFMGADCQSTGGVDAGPDGEQCDVDSSFSADTTFPLTLGETATGTLCPARDRDWFKFTISEPGSVVQIELSMDTNLTPVEPGYTIVTADDMPTGISGADVDRTPGEAVHILAAHRIENAGDYIIQVYDIEGFDDRFDITNEYSLNVTVVPDPDGNELNDTPDTATPLTLGTATTGLIGTTGDEDWFAIPVEADAQVVDVTVRASSDIGIDLRMEVYQSDGTTLNDSRDFLPDEDDIVARSVSQGRGAAGDVYYVRVFDEGADDAQPDPALGTFEVLAVVTADPDPQEALPGNEDADTPIVVQSGDSFTGKISYYGDQDFFQVVPPANTSPTNAQVLLINLTLSAAVPEEAQPQLRVLAQNPQVDTFACETTCQADSVTNEQFFCIPDGVAKACGRVYLQRVLTQDAVYSTGFPVRRARPITISVNDFGDDGFLEDATYTISFELIPEPEGANEGDDYIIPNLQNATYDNSGELDYQFDQGRDNARNLLQNMPPPCYPDDAVTVGVDGGLAFPPSCNSGPDAGPPPDPCYDPPPGCIGIEPVPEFGGGAPYTATCTGQEYSITAQGQLTYEGDRDYFAFTVPDVGYWGLEADYSVTATGGTPVELTAFVHASDGINGGLVAAWLDAPETPVVTQCPDPQISGCCDPSHCEAGSTCIDRKCWADADSNPGFANRTFPSGDQCFYVNALRERPLLLEVVDNGINDFDANMSYTITITAKCGCPASCNGGGGFCQGVAPPP